MHWVQEVFGNSANDTTWWQMSARAAVLFVWGVMLVRLLGHRLFGKNAALDIMLAVILGSVLSRAITGNAPMGSAMAATAVLMVLHWLAARLAWRWPWFGRLTKGHEIPLVKDGDILWDAMRRNSITRHDLEEALRIQGVSGLKQVRAAYLERNGRISVIPW